MKVLFLWLLFISSASLHAAETVIADMDVLVLDDWEQESFKGHTRYTLVNIDGVAALHAVSDNSASGLFRKQRIDLEKTPYLNWRWRVDQPLNGLDERTKAGDDYAARLYVMVSGGLFFWKTKAVNYVWSSSQAVGSHWDNAYTGQAQMVAVESGVENSGKWLSYKRHVVEDMRRLFGEDVRYIDGVAIMSDTDNSGGRVEAYYGDIYFSSE